MPIKSKIPDIILVGDAIESEVTQDDKVLTLAQQLSAKNKFTRTKRELNDVKYKIVI